METATARWVEKIYTVSTSAKVAEIRSRVPIVGRGAKPPRGTCSKFTPSSRRRLIRSTSAIPWDHYLTDGRAWLLVTLTYHGCPEDGGTTKRHLKRFRDRWDYHYGKPVAIWKREYQRRGSAHFHLLLVADSTVEIQTYRAWVALAWNECTEQTDDTQARNAGTNAEWWRSGEPTAYFAKYGLKDDGSKGYQNVAPVNVVNGGRWWGIWGARPEWTHAEVSREQWCSLRRTLTKAYYVRQRARMGRKARRRARGPTCRALWVAARSSRGWDIPALLALGSS